MLVLSRKAGQKIMIGDGISVVINRVAGNRVAIGIEAPDGVRILRGELESRGEDRINIHPLAAEKLSVA